MSATEEMRDFEALLEYVKRTRGFDFTGYKRSSLVRRVRKRMQLIGVDEFIDYSDRLEVNPDEFHHLFNTILINVTDFFRDTEPWDYLAQEILPRLLEAHPTGTIRVWDAGCSSGEETYTIAILLAEALGESAFRERVKIYATDADEEALNQARLASYDSKAVESIPPPLLEKYFERVNGGRYVFQKELRRSVIFGRHDLVQDAPISRADLLICRNTLMYFNADAQAHILGNLHFALNPDGYLFLGKSEMLLTHTSLFQPGALKHRIFVKVPRYNLRERLVNFSQNHTDDDAIPYPNHIRLRVAEEELRVQNEQLMGAQELLEAERQRYLDLFEFAPDAYLVTDLHGNIQEANRAASALLNLPPRMLLGKPLITFIPEPERNAFRDRLFHLTRQDSVAEWEITLRPRKEQRLYISVHVGVVHDWKGERIGLRWILRDISAYMATLGSLRDLQTEAQEEQSHRETELQAALGQARFALTEEHRARAHAEAEQNDLRLLAHVSGALLKSLEPDTLLEELTGLCVPHLADWCAIDLAVDIPEAECLVRRVSTHRDPAQQQAVATLLTRFPAEKYTLLPLRRVLESGEAEWFPFVPEPSDLSDPAERVYLEALTRVGFASCVLLPLRAEGEVLGVLTLARGTNSPVYLERERVLLETIAGHTALALENAFRYQQVLWEVASERHAATESKRQRADLTARNTQLQRKMVETHHRVKNNLQMLASLVEVQMENDLPDSLKKAYHRLLLHIRALATLHELLTASSRKGDSEQTIHTEEMFGILMETLGQMTGLVNLTCSAQEAQLTPQQGTALALLTGELVSNAIKHGNGKVALRFQIEENQGILEITDDGPGFSPGFSPAQDAHTGLELVENLARFDLRGAVHYANHPEGGAVVRVLFPLLPPTPSVSHE
jgi:PAS domain S-box-containing protein